MPRIEVSYLTQKAVLWPYESVDMFNLPVRGTPVEISVRWEYAKAQKDQDEGTTARLVVDREIATRSLMWLGELADFYGTGSGAADVEIKEVEEYSEIPDIKGRVYYRTVKLRRFQGDIPPPPRVGTPSEVDLVVIGAGFGHYEITTGTGTGTDDVACSDCEQLNTDFDVVLTCNSQDLQVWESAEAFTTCGEDWYWHIERNLVTNVVMAVIEDESGEAQVTFSMSGTTWNGQDTVTLNRLSGNSLCEWPATLQLRGA